MNASGPVQPSPHSRAERLPFEGLAFPCPGCARRLVVLFRVPGETAICHDCGMTAVVPDDAARVEDPLGVLRLVDWWYVVLRNSALVAFALIVLGALILAPMAWLEAEGWDEFTVPQAESWPADVREQRLWELCERAQQRVGFYALLLPTTDEHGAPAIRFRGERLERWRIESALEAVTQD